MTTPHKLGDTVRVFKRPLYDTSPQAMQRTIENVMRFIVTGEMVDDNPPELVTLTTQEMVDKYNETGQI